jgi:peptidoglycan/xylan/chitin deacetylase (PgdA/CDA1 family)
MIEWRNFIKKKLGMVFKYSLGRVYRKSYANPTVFVFHDITDHPSQFSKQYGLAISLESFSKQIDWIDRKYKIIHPVDLINNKNIPKNSAVISFDDGFLGSFENGLNILNKKSIPSILFLNMQPIIEQSPLVSAVACYIEKNMPDFRFFSKKYNISFPLHLSLTASHLALFEKEHEVIDKDSVLLYQGEFANIDIVKKWGKSDLVVYGNHLYNHWNVLALSPDELKEQYLTNEKLLSQFKNSVNLFAFPNGQPETCFTERDVSFIKSLGAEKVFSASGGVNYDSSDFMVNRMSLYEKDKDEDYIWFQLGRSLLRNVLHKRL